MPNDAPPHDAAAHWTATWLARMEELDLDVERLPPRGDLLGGGRPIKVFLDGKLTVRLSADAEEVRLELLTGPATVPGCQRSRAGWHATYALDDAPTETLQQAWLSVLTRLGRARKAPTDAEPVEDDAYHWVWDNRARLTERSLQDRDRKPFSEKLRRAFGNLTEDEQRLLRAQWEREATEDGPTVAESLGWSGKQVMDVYRSAMGKLKAAGATYRRPRKPRK